MYVRMHACMLRARLRIIFSPIDGGTAAAAAADTVIVGRETCLLARTQHLRDDLTMLTR